MAADANYTHMTIVLDRSGSMHEVKKDTEGGFNSFIEKQKKVKGTATVTLVQFDTVYDFVYKQAPLEQVKPLVLEPRGSTALLDAIGRAINETGAWLLNVDEDKRPGHVLFVIITDGHENASVEFTRPQVFDMITHQQEKYQWTFVFLGANQNAIKTGMAMGVPISNNLTYAANTAGVQALYSSLDNQTSSLRGGHTVSTSSFFTDEDIEAQKKAGTA